MLANQCDKCTHSEETVDYLPLHFPEAMELWNVIIVVFGVS